MCLAPIRRAYESRSYTDHGKFFSELANRARSRPGTVYRALISEVGAQVLENVDRTTGEDLSQLLPLPAACDGRLVSPLDEEGICRPNGCLRPHGITLRLRRRLDQMIGLLDLTIDGCRHPFNRCHFRKREPARDGGIEGIISRLNLHPRVAIAPYLGFASF